MASFRVKCPSCEALVPIRDEGMIGRKIDCPKCKYRFVVEEPEDTQATESAAEEEAPAKTETKIKAAKGTDKSKVSKSAVTAKAKVKAGLKETNPDDEVENTAVTTKAKGKAGPKKTDPDEADEDAPAKKPAKKGPSMLVIGGGLGVASVIALGVALYFFLSGPSKAGNQQAKNPSPAGSGNQTQTPKDPKNNQDPKDKDPKNNKDPKEKDPKEKDKPQGSGPQVALSDITNLLPNDTRAVINLSLDNLRTSSINTAMLKTAGAFNAKAFLQTFGFPIEDVSRVVMAFNDAQRWTFCVVRTSKPVKQEDLISRLNASAEVPIKLHAYYLVKRDLDPLGNFLLRNPEGNYFLKGETRSSQFAMHILDPQTLVFADFDPMKKFLEDDCKPAVIFQSQPTTPVVPSTPPAGTPPTGGQPPTGMGPGGQPPTGMGGPGGQQPGGMGPGGKQRPPFPGGTPPTGQQPPTGMGPGMGPGGQPPTGMGPGGQQRPPYPGGNSPPGQPPTGMGPGGQSPPNPMAGVPPTGQTPGGAPPNGKPATETPPAPVAPVPAPPAVPSWITIKPEMKSVLDSVEKGDKPVIISFAGDIHFLLGLFGQMREQVAANKLDINYVLGFIGHMRELMAANKEKGSLDIVALKNLEDFNVQMEDLFKAAAVSILSFREDRLVMAAAIEGNGEKGVERVRELYKWLNSPEAPPANSTRPNQPGGFPGFTGQPGSMAGYPGGQAGMPLTPQGPSLGGVPGNSGPYPGQPGAPSSGGMQGYPGGNTGAPQPPGGGKQRPGSPYPGGPGGAPPPGGPGGVPPTGGPGFPPTGGPGTGLPGTGKPTPAVKTHSGDWVITISNGTLMGKLARGIRSDDYNHAMTTLEKAMVVLRGESDMVNSRSRIHELAAALQRYVKAKGNFPPGTLNRTESAELLLPLPPQKRLSWMVDLLPFLAGGEFKVLPFDYGKTWSEGQNGVLARLVIPQYVVRGSKPELPYRIKYPGTSEMFAATHYVGIAGVGLDAAYYQANDAAASKRIGIFGYDRVTKPADIKDGPEQTIALLMVPVDHKSPWIAGGGSTVRGVSEELDCFKPFVCAEYNGKKGSYAIMADGKVRFIPESIAPETFRALCTINGGEKIEKLDTIAPEIFPDVTSTELKTADVVLPAGGDKKPAEPTAPAPVPAKVDAQENLETLIPEMIRLMEAKEYGKLLGTAVLPEDLERMVKQLGSLDKVADRFGQEPERVANLLKVLRQIQTVKPTLSADGKTATYKHSVPTLDKKDTIVFVRVGKLWYVKN